MLPQKVCHWLGFVKFGFLQRSSTIEVGGVNICAVIDEQFRNGSLVRMGCGMQRRSTPVIIIVSCINICAEPE
jgi:hypothetical protein